MSNPGFGPKAEWPRRQPPHRLELGSIAKEWTATRCKGTINREFPSQLRDKTLDEIRQLSKIEIRSRRRPGNYSMISDFKRNDSGSYYIYLITARRAINAQGADAFESSALWCISATSSALAYAIAKEKCADEDVSYRNEAGELVTWVGHEVKLIAVIDSAEEFSKGAELASWSGPSPDFILPEDTL